jgi:hypothetical protein
MSFYEDLARERSDSEQLQQTVAETILRLGETATAVDRPGILLGKIQSGKTRAFLGVIAAAFDAGYDCALILTKGTKSLTLQTLSRAERDFASFRDADQVQVFDILNLPPNLRQYELDQKIIMVAKKEDDNLRRLLGFLDSLHPQLKKRRWLLIDDEADFASLTFKKKDGAVEPGEINRLIEIVRGKLEDSQFLQVTATPYALYLQPEEGMKVNGIPILRPRKPAFTVVLPSYPEYVGGDYYFEQSADVTSPASQFYVEVPQDERDALVKEDRRRFDIAEVLTSSKVAVLRKALLNFIVGACVRRWQQQRSGERVQKYSFVVHTEQGKAAHEWQQTVVSALWEALQIEARSEGAVLRALIDDSYKDIEASVRLGGLEMPDVATVEKLVIGAINGDQLSTVKVNSENQINALLDDSGQLRLRTPLNLFIGGQILDRGITIENLVGFYYGRNPQKSQQDTVLQHSRMYGRRPAADLTVTRLYAPLQVYNRMRQIHDLDAALRNAFISGAFDQGVYFMETDSAGRIVPCATNKLLISDVYSLRPGRRLLPTEFNTVSLARGGGRLQRLDELVHAYSRPPHDEPVLIPMERAIEMVKLAYDNLVFEDEDEGKASRKALIAALNWLAKVDANNAHPGQVWMIAAEERSVKRLREGGRFSNAPDTKQQRDLAESIGAGTPVLSMMRQRGLEGDGWRGLPFWWPVVMVPTNAITSIYSAN